MSALQTRATFPRLVLPYTAREIPRENDRDRAKRIARENERIPVLTYQSARDDMREVGIR